MSRYVVEFNLYNNIRVIGVASSLKGYRDLVRAWVGEDEWLSWTRKMTNVPGDTYYRIEHKSYGYHEGFYDATRHNIHRPPKKEQ